MITPPIEHRYLRHFDWIEFCLVFAISLIGLVGVFSATYKPDVPVSLFFKKQLVGMITGFGIYVFFCALDYRIVIRWGYIAYLGVIALLIFTMLKGSTAMGGQRWIAIAGMKLQPSELTKFLFPAFVAHYLHDQQDVISYGYKDFIPIIVTLGLSCFIIQRQPDLGTALVLLFSGLTLIWLSGINKKFFTYGLLFVIITAPLSWHILRPYQRKRILVYVGQGEKLKERYQIEQSKIAIGSGGFCGKGFLQGTQNKLHFLPEGRTDFIFSVICEEFGFVGAMILLLLYAALFMYLFFIILSIRPVWTRLFAFGLIIHIVFSTIINICMVTGLLPSVGIPLPLVTYGISQTWITLASLGLFASISMRRPYING